jgi:hypothetical protein
VRQPAQYFLRLARMRGKGMMNRGIRRRRQERAADFSSDQDIVLTTRSSFGFRFWLPRGLQMGDEEAAN